MGTTVNQFIEKLVAYRDSNPANGRAEIMIATPDGDEAFEFKDAHTANSVRNDNIMEKKDFLIFFGNTKGQRLKTKRLILQ